MSLIHLFTDFGYHGPYLGEMQAVLARANQHTIINLMHDVPAYNIHFASVLLNALSRQFQAGESCLAVVDPGVGSASRRPILIRADDIVYCGPDNGLFTAIVNRASQVEAYEITWRPETLSNSFHGRDLFAPALLRFLAEQYSGFSLVSTESLIGRQWPTELREIIYFDHYGNAISGIAAVSLKSTDSLSVNGTTVNYANTFAAVAEGEAFWYVNSMGLVEIAMNQRNAREQLALKIGMDVVVA